MNRHRARRGRMNKMWGLMLGGAAVVVGLIAMLQVGGPGETPQRQTLSLFCAAGMRTPVEAVAQRYEQEYGVHVEIQFDGSNVLLSKLELDRHGTTDLFLAADEFYTQQSQEKGLAAEVLPVATMLPVVAVRKDSAKNIQTLDDLLAADMKIAMADPDQAAIGRATRERLQTIPAGGTTRWEQLRELVTRNGVFKPTVTDVAGDVKLGAVDAGIVWDSTVMMPKFREELKAISLLELQGEPSLVAVCVLNSTVQPAAALKFARYLTARDRGLPLFEKSGMKPVDGDVWAERPELQFFSGAVNRRALEQIIESFETREGVEVHTIYDGCGILTGRMKGIVDQKQELGFPDVYMACDRIHLESVQDWFQEAIEVSDVEMVIAVPKGSDKVSTLADLIKPGIRVAIGQPDQCTVGTLTRRMLVDAGLYEQLKAKQAQPGEVVVEKSSSALIVPDVVTGHVDAAVAYLTDVLPNLATVDYFRIDSDAKVAVQPLSIAKTSDHKYLVRRLMEHVKHSQAAFERVGFHFRLEQAVKDTTAAEAGTGTP